MHVWSNNYKHRIQCIFVNTEYWLHVFLITISIVTLNNNNVYLCFNFSSKVTTKFKDGFKNISNKPKYIRRKSIHMSLACCLYVNLENKTNFSAVSLSRINLQDEFGKVIERFFIFIFLFKNLSRFPLQNKKYTL